MLSIRSRWVFLSRGGQFTLGSRRPSRGSQQMSPLRGRGLLVAGIAAALAAPAGWAVWRNAGPSNVAPQAPPSPVAPENLGTRSEEHTSELQSRENIVCRLLLEKKNNYSSSSSLY